MMRLGDRHYELVRSQSGFSVSLRSAQAARGPQAWQLDLHYVPAENNPQPRKLWETEYLELCFQPFRFQTADWRELSGFGPGPELDPILFNITLGNLLDGGDSCQRSSVFPDEISVKYLGGFRFRCHFEGRITDDGKEKNWNSTKKFPSRRSPSACRSMPPTSRPPHKPSPAAKSS